MSNTIMRCPVCGLGLNYRKKDGSYTCYRCHNKEVYHPEVSERSASYTERKKALSPKQVVTRPVLLETIRKIKKARDRAMISFLYLTGARIEEVVGIRTQPKKIVKLKKDGTEKLNKSGIPVLERRSPNEVTFLLKPITKDQITYSNYEGQKVVKINNMPILKKSRELQNVRYSIENVSDKIETRTVVLIYDIEREFWNLVQQYLNTIPDTAILFPVSYQRAWQITKHNTGYHNHYLRHTRVSHLKIHHDFSSIDLQDFIGWKDPRMPQKYAHLEWRNLAAKMIRNRF